MWKYDFSDYNLYCRLMNIKASRYTSLLEYKKFLKYEKELEW